MSITNELREYTGNFYLFRYKDVREKLDAIADRIDAEHERQLEALYHDMSDAEYVKLPVDADGEPWHLGDELMMENEVCEVVGVGGNCGNTIFYAFGNGVEWTLAHNNRHYHKPTVEDVLEELLREYDRDDSELTNGEIVERFAAKLQLRGDAE